VFLSSEPDFMGTFSDPTFPVRQRVIIGTECGAKEINGFDVANVCSEMQAEFSASNCLFSPLCSVAADVLSRIHD
jgi:hypothetical protein